MILALEPCWTGTTHAPGNGATLQVVARAFPDEELRVHADPSHLDELRRDAALMALPGLRLVPVALSSCWPGRPQIVCWRRMLHEARMVLSALRAVPADMPCLVLLLSTTATTPFAAAWAARLSGRRTAVQVVMHGNLNDISGWRPRNPFARVFDTLSALGARYPVPLRFVVLEEAIRTALAKLVPGTEARTDVVPLPMNTAEAGAAPVAPSGPPLSIGFVGLGTPEKGMDRFVAMARRLRARHGARLRFVHVGRMPEGADMAAAAEVFADPPASVHLPRAEFQRRMGALDCIVLPYRRGYYDLSASGALLDAVTWLKPVIATRVPLTEQFFAEHGAFGVLCDDDDAMEHAIEQLLLRPDAAGHARWIEALSRARAARAPEALAQRYRNLVESGFPGLLATGAAA